MGGWFVMCVSRLLLDDKGKCSERERVEVGTKQKQELVTTWISISIVPECRAD